jgi:hypothetical protein
MDLLKIAEIQGEGVIAKESANGVIGDPSTKWIDAQ